MKDVWPELPRQRCIAHKIRNILNRVPKKNQAELKRAGTNSFCTPCQYEVKQEASRFLAKYGKRYAMACENLCRDLYDCQNFNQFPEAQPIPPSAINSSKRIGNDYKPQLSSNGHSWKCDDGLALSVVSPTNYSIDIGVRDPGKRSPELAWTVYERGTAGGH